MTRCVRLTFGLRTPIAVFTLIALAMGWFADRIHRRRAAVELIESLGGSLHSDYESRVKDQIVSRMYKVPLPIAKRTWSERILGDRQRNATLWDQALSPRALDAIASLEELRSLDLSRTNLNDHQLLALRRLNQLESLDLSDCPITDEAAQTLAEFQNLKRLELNDTLLSDRAVAHLLKLRKLEFLCICRTSITDRGISQLQTLPNLATFDYDDPAPRPAFGQK